MGLDESRAVVVEPGTWPPDICVVLVARQQNHPLRPRTQPALVLSFYSPLSRPESAGLQPPLAPRCYGAALRRFVPGETAELDRTPDCTAKPGKNEDEVEG